MSQSNINWDLVEEVSKTFFPDEYKAVTRKQRKSMEDRISKGQPPIVPDIEAGGMHNIFTATVDNMGSILTAISIIITWYTWKHPKKERRNQQDFLNYLKEDPKTLQTFNEMVNKAIKQSVEKNFAPILTKLDELKDILSK